MRTKKEQHDADNLRTFGKYIIGGLAVSAAVFSASASWSHFSEFASLVYNSPSSFLSSAIVHDNLLNVLLYGSTALATLGLSFASFKDVPFNRHIITNTKRELHRDPHKLAYLGSFAVLVALEVKKPINLLTGSFFNSFASRSKNVFSSISGFAFGPNVVEYYNNIIGFFQAIPAVFASLATMHILSKSPNPGQPADLADRVVNSAMEAERSALRGLNSARESLTDNSRNNFPSGPNFTPVPNSGATQQRNDAPPALV